jgi:hypothetical protein
MRSKILAVIFLALVNIGGLAQTASSPNLDSYIQELRADVRADKTKIFSQTIKLTDEQSKNFWPIYNRYDSDLATLNDRRIDLLKQYARAYPNIEGSAARDMGARWLELEARKVDLQKKYFDEIAKKVSPEVAAKFLQVNHRIELLLDIQGASDIPLVPDKSGVKAEQ